MQHWLSTILSITGAIGHWTQWHRAVYSRQWSNGWKHSVGITEHERIHTTRTAAFTNRRNNLISSAYDFCVTSHCAFSVQALSLLADGFESVPPKSHFNEGLPPIAPLFPNISHGATVYRSPLLHWAPESQKHNAGKVEPAGLVDILLQRLLWRL